MITTLPAFPSMVDHLVEQVFQRILSGEFASGSKLTEEQLALLFGASRTPIREAIRRLGEFGILVLRPRCGLEVATIDERDVAEIRALRAELESFAVREAVKRAVSDDIAALTSRQEACEAILDNDNRLEVFRRDSAFHLEIARVSANRYLYDILRRLDPKVLLCRMLLCRTPEKVRSTVEFHRTILTAFTIRDAAAAERAIREHIADTQL